MRSVLSAEATVGKFVIWQGPLWASFAEEHDREFEEKQHELLTCVAKPHDSWLPDRSKHAAPARGETAEHGRHKRTR